MSEPNERDNEIAERMCGSFVDDAREIAAYREEIEARLAPAPAQSREEEALILKVLDHFTLCDDPHWRLDATMAKDAFAALRSRQSPPDTSMTLGVGDGTGKLFVHGDYESIKACQAKLLELDRLQSAAPQPSPQGEDADNSSRNWVRRIRSRNPNHKNSWTWTNKEAAERLGEYFKAIERARLASAQSSAQGEEAREMREPVRWFADRMEEKLKENDHKGGWADCDEGWLLGRLREEVNELDAALLLETPALVQLEAADVANFAMMIADKARAALERKEQVE